MSEREIRKALKKQLRGASGEALDRLAARLSALGQEAAGEALDIAGAVTGTSLRAGVELLEHFPEVHPLIEIGDARVWAEIGKRLAATSVDTAVLFFRESRGVLARIAPERRAALLKLVNKQAMLSASTALETFRAAPDIISAIADAENLTQTLLIALELARHSVKHSYDFFTLAPRVIDQLLASPHPPTEDLVRRALAVTTAFAFRSGGTAAEFFAELPAVAAHADDASLKQLFANTENYLDRSGGVALQYFRAAGRVLTIAGGEAFERWTQLAKRVALQGNAASYHFMKASPQVVAELAARAGRARGPEVITAVLEIVEEIAERNTAAAVECFNASPLALRAATLGQFRDWALRGIENETDNSRRIQAYYALESKTSQEALFKIEGGLPLDAVAQTLRLYVEGLTGQALHIASLASIPDESRIGDGKTIYLPSVVAEFEDEPANFRLFKVLAAHAAGQIEFATYAAGTPELLGAQAEIRAAFAAKADTAARRRNGGKTTPAAEVDFHAVLAEFPNPELALRLFTTLENGRIDFLLRNAYRGIRRDLDFVRARLRERRPRLDEIAIELVPFELLFQTAICGGATDEARRLYPTAVGQLESILAAYIFRADASVADTLMATLHVYQLFVEQPMQSDVPADESSLGDSEGEGEGDLSMQSDETASGEPRQQAEVRQDPFSFWSSSQAEEVSAESDVLSQFQQGESREQDLEKGDRAFYYDEWDRELGDYRTRWCRVIERVGARGSRSFVESVRTRYAGIISSVRYQFQLMRPENLRRIRGEVDGEDFDLQAVIDYALDKRSTGLIDDRLYTRKLRRERDVAVSFLLDMSSSTARTISRHPNKPYTYPGQRIIDIEKEGLVLMSEALEAVGDVYAMQGFTSEGRRNVKFYVIKDFDERYSPEIERRIGSITYQNNTRLGSAIRHAVARLASQRARTRLLIVLSDGRPYDHDYGDSRYAREDTRIALRQGRMQGITPFCITIDRESEDQLRDMYGEVGYTIIDDVLSLPERLPGIYRRLTI